MANAVRDGNRVPTLIGVSNADGTTPVLVYADPTTHRLLVDSAAASGTVTSVSVVSANGFAGTVATATTTPAITLTTTVTGVLKGNGTAISAAVAGTDYTTPTGTENLQNKTLDNTNSITVKDGSLTIENTADTTKKVVFALGSITTGTTRTLTVPDASLTIVGTTTTQTLQNKTLDNTSTITVKDANFTMQDDADTTKQLVFQLSGITTGTTRTVTLPDASGTMTLLGNASTGSGSVVLATSPTLVTPTLGVASATTINKVTITAPATGSTLTIADGKTLTASNSITLAGTDGKSLTLTNGLTVTTNDGTIAFGAASKTLTINKSLTLDGTDSTTMTFPSTSATIARTDAGQTFTGTQVFTSPKIITSVIDTNGNTLINIGATASAVNYVKITNAATGTAGPILAADGETNVDLKLAGKGTGAIHHTTGSYGDITTDTDGATVTFNCATSNIHAVTLGGNRTLALSNDKAGQCIILDLIQDATGSRTVTWFSGIKWAGGTTPTLTTTASKADSFGIRVITAGSAYYGFVIGQNI